MRVYFFFALGVFLFIAAPPALAEQPDLQEYRERLPEKTLFYLSWQNLQDFDSLSRTNPLLRFLGSPEMKTNWVNLLDYLEQLEEYEQARRKQKKEREQEDTEEKEPKNEPPGEKSPKQQSGEPGQTPSQPGETSAVPPSPLKEVSWEKLRAIFSHPGLMAVVTREKTPEEMAAEEKVTRARGADSQGEEETEEEEEKEQEEQEEQLEFPSLPLKFAFLFLYEVGDQDELFAELRNDILFTRAVETREYTLERLTVAEHFNAAGQPLGYTTRIGPWVAGGDERTVAEAWFRSLQEAPGTFPDTADNRATVNLFPSGAQVSIFFNISSFAALLEQVPLPPKAQISAPRLVEALRLKDWDALAFDFALEPKRIRYGARLRQAAGADGQDILASSATNFASLDFAPRETLNYSVTRWNFAAIWQYLQQLFSALLPPQQAQGVYLIQAVLEGVLGQPLSRFTAAWGPELAQMSYPSPGAPEEVAALTAIRLQNTPTILDALRNLQMHPLLSSFVQIDQISPESLAEEASFFQFSIPSAPEEEDNGEETEPFLYVAVTPEWALVGSTLEDLRGALERVRTSAPTLRDSASFHLVRSHFPASLTGMSFIDAERWIESGALEKAIEEATELMVEQARERIEKKREKEQEKAETEKRGEEKGREAEGQPQLKRRESDQSTEPTLPFPEPPKWEIPHGYLKWLSSATYRVDREIRATGYIE